MDTLKFLRLNAMAILPTRGSDHAAGLDLYSIETLSLGRGKRATIRTGLSVAIPQGCYGRIAPRSGLALERGIDVLAGVIDADYRGEVLCILINHGDTDFVVGIGDRIAQLILEKIVTPQPEWADGLVVTPRDDKGFGSTGA